jgi:hypothetical protein
MPHFIGYEDMSGVLICGPLFDCRGVGEAPIPQSHRGILLLYYSIHSIKKSRKEMASLCKNGQK